MEPQAPPPPLGGISPFYISPQSEATANLYKHAVAAARIVQKQHQQKQQQQQLRSKRYARCLQISEVVNSMKDLIDYSLETGAGPMESLAKYPRRTNPSPLFQSQAQQPESHYQQQQQTAGQNSNNENSANTIANLLHQNSINFRPQNQPMSNPNASYGGNSFPMPSFNMPQTNPSPSPFQSPTPSSSNNNNNNNYPKPASHTSLSGAPLVNSPSISMLQQQQPALSGAADVNDTQSTVQKIIHDMMMSSQLGGDARNVNGVMSANANIGFINGGNNNILMGTGVANGGNSIGVPGFDSMQNRLYQPAMANGIHEAFGNNHSVSMNGRAVGMNSQQQQQQQQDMSHQLLNSLGAVNGFNNLQFDWKNSL